MQPQDIKTPDRVLLTLDDPGIQNATEAEIVQKAQRHSEAIQTILDERNRVLQTLDERTIKDFFDKHKVPYPSNPITFWVTVHKTITAIEELPTEFRRRSAHWLREHKFTTLDDGDL